MSLNPPPSPAPRRSLPLVLVVAAILVVAGVSIGGTAAYFDLKGSSSPGPSPSSVVVTDDTGRTITAPQNAPRMLVLSPSIMDIVFRLGLREHVVGVGCSPSLTGGILNEYSPNQTMLWGLTNASCVTDYPTLNTEAVANLTPGLVLASTITSQNDVDRLTQTYGIPVVILAPATLDGIVGDVRIVGQLYPAAASNATALESQLGTTLSAATSVDTNLTNTAAPIPSVLLSYYFDSGGYYSYGPGSFGASLIGLAAGDNLAGAVPLLYAEVNATVVLNDQPSVILYGTSWNDPYLVSFETPTVWPTAPYWGQLTGQKIPVDVTLVTEADPSMILLLPLLMHWLHPTLVPTPPA
ncbi:MAG: ABC transporter substrate-binding protein [Thermoplasmata archaeon]|nr:ABC transporter substrate-binding protein [Thermoplasmata archaeon]